MTQRGVVYGIAGAAETTIGGLVLTNDRWNERMSSSVVVPVVNAAAPAQPIRVELTGGSGVANAGRLLAVPHASISDALLAVSPDDLAAVEGELVAVLGLATLISDHPRAPRPPPGAIDYPRWSEIYWPAATTHDGETKRCVVVSNDVHDKATGEAIVVRLTTSPKHPHEEFPVVSHGASQACCGDATTVTSVDMRRRPTPSRLGLADMASVAAGLVSVLELSGAVERA